MTEAAATTDELMNKKRWPVRVTLYQSFAIFSIVAAVLLLRHIENQQVELRTKRATLFSLDRDLYIDDPNRLAGIQKPIRNQNELAWSVYIPPGVCGTLFVEGQKIGELNSGHQQIRALLRRESLHGGPRNFTVEKLLLGAVSKDVNFSIQEVFDDPSTTAPITAALSEKLPLLLKPGEEQEIQMWVEAN